uniref:Ig-like domain-containing protein n=1 Tax=Neogobius melanostomus TaxID=47308 RepID=A0A8C6U514_9GOBI
CNFLCEIQLIIGVFDLVVTHLQSIPSSPVLHRPQESLSLSCSGAGFTFGSYGMHWIRQAEGKALDGWVALKDSLRSKFSISLDASSKTVTLTGNNMQPGDTAVYYCARQAQSHREYEELNKNTSGCYSLHVQ